MGTGQFCGPGLRSCGKGRESGSGSRTALKKSTVCRGCRGLKGTQANNLESDVWGAEETV